MRKTIKIDELLVEAEKRIKGFLYAQYDAFENTKSDPTQPLGLKHHDYYWEAIGIFSFMMGMELMNQEHISKYIQEVKLRVKEIGCKAAYFQHNGVPVPSYAMTFDELVKLSTKTNNI